MRKRALFATLALATAGVVIGPTPTVADDAELTNPLTPAGPSGMTAWNGWVYFSGQTSDIGSELWRTADVRFDVRVAATKEWVAAATTGPAPRSVTVDLTAGSEYRLAVWSTSGTADFEVTLTPPGP